MCAFLHRPSPNHISCDLFSWFLQCVLSGRKMVNDCVPLRCLNRSRVAKRERLFGTIWVDERCCLVFFSGWRISNGSVIWYSLTGLSTAIDYFLWYCLIGRNAANASLVIYYDGHLSQHNYRKVVPDSRLAGLHRQTHANTPYTRTSAPAFILDRWIVGWMSGLLVASPNGI